MKLLPQLLLNLVVVGVALFAYDALRADTPPAGETVLGETPDVTALENRIARLEAGLTPTLRAEGIDPRLEERIAALEARLSGVSPSASAASDTPTVSGTREAPPLFQPKGDAGTNAPPTDDEVARFLAIQKAALARQRMDRQRDVVAMRVAKAGVQLSKGQQEKLVAAYVSFQKRRNAIWSEAKTSAQDRGPDTDWKTVLMETQRRIRSEFSREVGGFLSPADADAVATSLFPTSK